MMTVWTGLCLLLFSTIALFSPATGAAMTPSTKLAVRMEVKNFILLKVGRTKLRRITDDLGRLQTVYGGMEMKVEEQMTKNLRRKNRGWTQ